MENSQKIIIFDGVCNLCNAGVNFIIKRDSGGVFRFTPMQSDIGQQLINRYYRSEFDSDTFLLIKEGECLERSDAALEVINDLPIPWSWLGCLKILPKSIRDAVYSFIAKHRFRLFGKRSHCAVPTPDTQNRFLTEQQEHPA